MAASGATTPQQPLLESDIAEFALLLGATTRNLKSAGPPPAALRDALQRAGLGPRHMQTLLMVALAGPLSVTELSERLGLQLSTTSTMIGELSRSRLLERVEDDNDRRRTIIHLQVEYRGELESWLQRAITPIRAALGRLSPAARAHFMEGWRILHEEAARGAGSDEDGACHS